jgi:hypothetical protein
MIISIGLKFGTNVEDVFFIHLFRFQIVWTCWKEIKGHFIFRSQVASKEYQNLPFDKAKWIENLKIGNRHIFSCYTKIWNWPKFMCKWVRLEKKLVTKSYIKKVSTQNLQVEQLQTKQREFFWNWWKISNLSRKFKY